MSANACSRLAGHPVRLTSPMPGPHSDELAESGSMLVAYALTPRDMATSIRGDTITDGPFVDSKEVVAGFYVIEAPDLDAALAIARLNPVVREGGGVEVRPVHSSFVKSEEQTTA